jgi:hypothetical protein
MCVLLWPEFCCPHDGIGALPAARLSGGRQEVGVDDRARREFAEFAAGRASALMGEGASARAARSRRTLDRVQGACLGRRGSRRQLLLQDGHPGIQLQALDQPQLCRGQPGGCTMVAMRSDKESSRVAGGVPLEQRIQFARGHWRRDEQAGAIRSAGWWESVTVTLSPAGAPTRTPSLLHRALAGAVDTIVPALADAVAARAMQLMDHRSGARAALTPLRRRLPASPRALPSTGKHH